MEEEGLIAFHEKLYYHELDSREKLIARLQLCLAILSLLAGLMIYLVAHFDPTAVDSSLAAFAILVVTFTLGAALLITAAYEYVSALWNHRYQCLPLPVAIEEYRELLVTTYAEHGAEYSTREYHKFLKSYLAKCASSNAEVNARRYEHCHNCLSYIVYSLLPIAVAGLTFVVGGFLKQAAS